ncbi:isoprenoid synthase domain-containing protein [Xylaria nigripes]|nr:isoprenoid synthase domain-containing protein [Xylaria nigripes]
MQATVQTQASSPWTALKCTLRPLLNSLSSHQLRSTRLGTSTLMSKHSQISHIAKDDFEVKSQQTAATERTQDTSRSKDDMELLSGFSWSEEKENIIMSPYDYIASEPGKEFRTVLLNAFNAWLEVPQESLDMIMKVVRMLHTASLLIDDIQDNSVLRRGRPVAHSIFGVAQTINAGNYVYFLALSELQNLSDPMKAMEIYTTEMLYLHRGQGMDLYWRDTLTCPTEDDYMEMVSNKTGGLFRLAVKLMQSQSTTAYNCLPLAELLGQVFQIADDYKNLVNVDYTQKKGLCEDLTEGKFSFPILHSIRSNPSSLELLHILAQRPTDIDTKKYAVRCIEKTGSLGHTKELVSVLIGKARREADSIDPGSGKSKSMHALLGKLELE